MQYDLWTLSLWSFHTEVTSSVQQQLWNSVSPLLSRVPFNKEPVQHKRQHGHKSQIEPVIDLRRLDAALTHFLHVGPLSSRTNLPKHIIVSKILISSKSTLKVVFHLIALLYSFKSTIHAFLILWIQKIWMNSNVLFEPFLTISISLWEKTEQLNFTT